MVDDVEALLALGIVDAANVDQAAEVAERIVAQQRDAPRHDGRREATSMVSSPSATLASRVSCAPRRSAEIASKLC